MSGLCGVAGQGAHLALGEESGVGGIIQSGLGQVASLVAGGELITEGWPLWL